MDEVTSPSPHPESLTYQQSTLLDQLNTNSQALCRDTAHQSARLSVEVHNIAEATVLDFAVQRHGTIAGGIRLAEICLAGLADVKINPPAKSELPLPSISVATDFPLAACIASQYAGWPFSTENYFAMCSGPARMLRGQESILLEHGLKTSAPLAIGIFESNQLPDADAVQSFADECQTETNQVTICVARTASFPGSLQVVARSIETTLHKLHELKFDLTTIRSGFGTAPLPPIAADDLTALGWTNDCILYGCQVNLWVETEDVTIEAVLTDLPSSGSRDFGSPFLEIFKRYNKDFYKIDKMLFSPAQVIINNLKTGNTFVCGELRNDILRSSFGINFDSSMIANK